MASQDRCDETQPLLDGSTISRPSYSNTPDNDHVGVDVLTIKSSSSSSSTSCNKDLAQTTRQTVSDDVVAQRLNGAPLYMILTGLWTGVCLASLDASIVATIYPEIGTEFRRSNEIIWVATAYLLSYTALQPLYGRISDAFGRRTAYLFAAVVFFIGSFFCGAANSLWTLVAARAVAGIGGGGLNTMSAVITSELVSLRERGKYQGYANIAYGLGSVIGAPLGGFITDTVGWRYCFYVNLPLLLISLYVGFFLMTDYNLKEQEDESTISERFKKIDYLGATMVVSTVVTFLLASSFGGNTRPWSDPLVVGCLISSVLFAIAFCFVEANVAKNPLMPWNIITAKTPLACALLNFFSIMASYAMTYTTPLYFQGLKGYSPSHSGLFFIPKVIAISVGSLASGFYMSSTGEYRRYLIFSSAVSLVAMIGYSMWTPTSPLYFIISCLVFDGFSSGSILTSSLVAMLTCVKQKEMATITSISYLFRSAGGVIGISLTSAIFQGLVKHILTEKITGPGAAEIIEIARKSMTNIRELLAPDVLQIVLDAYEVAIRYAFLLCIGITGLSLLSSLFIEQNELHNKVTK